MSIFLSDSVEFYLMHWEIYMENVHFVVANAIYFASGTIITCTNVLHITTSHFYEKNFSRDFFLFHLLSRLYCRVCFFLCIKPENIPRALCHSLCCLIFKKFFYHFQNCIKWNSSGTLSQSKMNELFEDLGHKFNKERDSFSFYGTTVGLNAHLRSTHAHVLCALISSHHFDRTIKSSTFCRLSLILTPCNACVAQYIIPNYICFFSLRRRRLEAMNMNRGRKHVRHSHHCVPYCARIVWKLNTSFRLSPCFNLKRSKCDRTQSMWLYDVPLHPFEYLIAIGCISYLIKKTLCFFVTYAW